MTSVVDLSETKNAKRKKEELEAVIADQEKQLQFIRKGRMVLAEMEEERNKDEDVFVVDINLGPQFEEVEAQLQRIAYFLESINNALLNFTDALKKHEET